MVTDEYDIENLKPIIDEGWSWEMKETFVGNNSSCFVSSTSQFSSVC